jgi:hypothetical protein
MQQASLAADDADSRFCPSLMPMAWCQQFTVRRNSPNIGDVRDQSQNH